MLFQLAQGKARLLFYRKFIRRLQPPTVNKVRFPIYVIFELVFPVRTDGFTPAENPVLGVTPVTWFLCQLRPPP